LLPGMDATSEIKYKQNVILDIKTISISSISYYHSVVLDIE